MTELRATGGFCAPWDGRFDYSILSGDDIYPNGVAPRYRNRTLLGRLKNFFAWDKGWGFPLRGGPLPRLRDLMPVCTATRGAIVYRSMTDA